MRRASRSLGLAVLGGLLASLPPALAEKPRADRPILPQPAKTLSEELVAVLDQTQSPDTFLATVLVLEKVKGDPKVVIPAVLRNAERLRIYEAGADRLTGDRLIILKMIETSLAANCGSGSSGQGTESPRASLKQQLMRWGLYSTADRWLDEPEPAPDPAPFNFYQSIY